jgi:P pilus assembly chaperone PapD
MSFFSVSLGSGGQYDINVDGGMISPKGTISIPLGDVEKITKPYNQLKVDFINDFGGPSPVEFAVNLRP